MLVMMVRAEVAIADRICKALTGRGRHKRLHNNTKGLGNQKHNGHADPSKSTMHLNTETVIADDFPWAAQRRQRVALTP